METIFKTIVLVAAGYWAVNKILPALKNLQPVINIENGDGSGNNSGPGNSGKNNPTGPATPADVNKTDPENDTPFFGINNRVSY